jgi:hypothetical protein
MIDALDLDLQDRELIDEIHLVADLMVAAAQSPCRLSEEQIDAILGAAPPPG